MYFHTRAEAERKRGELVASTRTKSKVDVLSPAQIRDAVRALERLAEAGIDISLDKAVEIALPHLKSSGRHVSVNQVCREFAESKAQHGRQQVGEILPPSASFSWKLLMVLPWPMLQVES